MSYLQTLQVFPYVPEPLSFLEVLVRNLWWCWHLDAIELFRRISPKLWQESGRNPIVFSTLIPQERLEELARDDSFLAHQERVKHLFESQISTTSEPSDSAYGEKETIAYFSMEFGIHESLPLFAGGLGILAGDHLKAASDLALPLTGIGIIYKNGYFRQFLNHDGWQQEAYPETDIYRIPVERAKDVKGNEVRITLDGPHGKIHAMVWKIKVGRIPLFLLDTNIVENPPDIRKISHSLYSGDPQIRLAQEVLLGIGGVRALDAMGANPVVCHMNEGHCAFSSIQRLANIMTTHNVDLKTALEIIPRSTVFTTHTPVAAGHDEFPPDIVKPYLKPFEEQLGTSIDDILSWGQHSGPDSPFSMSILGIRMAQHCNGVSELHGKVARKMWTHLWPDLPEEEIPIKHITNGVHIPSWISIENALLFDRYLGPEWYLPTRNIDIIERINDIYDEELWRGHEMRRTRLIRVCRSLMLKQHEKRNAPKSIMKEIGSVLDQDALTIAFARRFASYKRANLLLHDPQRLEAILNSKEFPVQFIFAGKAHPQNGEGKELIQNLVQFARNAKIRHKIVFLEDYNIDIARHLVQGADIWLNTPRRPHEACGTSGIKAAANGVLNLSILDGWWCEGYSEECGWAIGNGEEYEDHDYQDSVESQALYNLLENEVIPCFYERKNDDVPKRWLNMMKASMKIGMERFCAHKMVDNYEKKFYIPAVERFHNLRKDDLAEAKNLSTLRIKLQDNWREIRVDHPVREADGPFRVGDALNITATVYLKTLVPEEVDVTLYFGKMASSEGLIEGYTEPMTVKEDRGNGQYEYTCSLNCFFAGRYGFTVRVMPRGDDLIRFMPGLITWAAKP
ncbi:MAG: glycosyltransferase family 1 protein [Desulfobacterales bacterium]|nr:glycosyltransferase family 1 protein [Desulfobacterales bacterium]